MLHPESLFLRRTGTLAVIISAAVLPFSTWKREDDYLIYMPKARNASYENIIKLRKILRACICRSKERYVKRKGIPDLIVTLCTLFIF